MEQEEAAKILTNASKKFELNAVEQEKKNKELRNPTAAKSQQPENRSDYEDINAAAVTTVPLYGPGTVFNPSNISHTYEANPGGVSNQEGKYSEINLINNSNFYEGEKPKYNTTNTNYEEGDPIYSTINPNYEGVISNDPVYTNLNSPIKQSTSLSPNTTAKNERSKFRNFTKKLVKAGKTVKSFFTGKKNKNSSDNPSSFDNPLFPMKNNPLYNTSPSIKSGNLGNSGNVYDTISSKNSEGYSVLDSVLDSDLGLYSKLQLLAGNNTSSLPESNNISKKKTTSDSVSYAVPNAANMINNTYYNATAKNDPVYAEVGRNTGEDNPPKNVNTPIKVVSGKPTITKLHEVLPNIKSNKKTKIKSYTANNSDSESLKTSASGILTLENVKKETEQNINDKKAELGKLISEQTEKANQNEKTLKNKKTQKNQNKFIENSVKSSTAINEKIQNLNVSIQTQNLYLNSIKSNLNLISRFLK